MTSSVPAVFKSIVYALVTAVFTSFEELSGAQEWARRYSDVVSKSPMQNPVPLYLPQYPFHGLIGELGVVGGRPLGLALDNAGDVLVCEPIQGQLLKISKDTGAIEILATEAEGVKFGIINEVIVAKDRLIYFTDSTSKYNLNIFWQNIEGTAYGRMMVVDPNTKSTKVLLRDLYFANDIALSKSEDYLNFCESINARCSKYFLRGSKRGTTEIFIYNPPGSPDNIHRNKARDRYYIAIIGNRDALMDFILTVPVLQQLLACNANLFYVLTHYPYMARFLEVDESGKPLQMYEDPSGKVVGFASTAVPHNGYVYVGGLRDDFVGLIKLR